MGEYGGGVWRCEEVSPHTSALHYGHRCTLLVSSVPMRKSAAVGSVVASPTPAPVASGNPTPHVRTQPVRLDVKMSELSVKTIKGREV